jgi:hypothetical protein
MPHPSDARLLNFSGFGPEGEGDRLAIGAHLDLPCARCRERVQRDEELRALLRARPLEEVPVAWTTRALARLRQEREQTEPQPSRRPDVAQAVRRAARSLEVWRAILVQDSLLGTALAGIRGTATAQPRQMLYDSEVGRVQLRLVREATGKLDLLGQFVPASGSLGPARARAILTREGTELVRRLSPDGEFRFRSLLPGSVRLRVEWDSQRLALDPLDLSAGQDR